MPTDLKTTNLNILLIEDTDTDAYTVKRVLGKYLGHPCKIRHAPCMADAESILKDNKDIDVILLDLGLPDTAGGNDTFNRIENVKEQIPVIILTSVHDHELAVGIVDKGAEDYVRKSSISADPEVLCDAIDFAVCRHKHVEEMKEQADKELEEKDQVIGWMSGNYTMDPGKK